MKKMIIIVLTAILLGVLLAACTTNHIIDNERYVSRYMSEDVLSSLLNNEVRSANVVIGKDTAIMLEKQRDDKDWFIVREYKLQEGGTYVEVDAIIATCSNRKNIDEKAKLMDEQIDTLLE